MTWYRVGLIGAMAVLAGEATSQRPSAKFEPPLEDLAAHAAREATRKPPTLAAAKSTSPTVSNDFISFAYIQNEGILFHVRWQALTHITALFTEFDANGNFTNVTATWNQRSSYLRAGGAAQAAGVKVIMIVNSFDDAPGGIIEQVVTTPAKRTTLVNNIVASLKNDPGGYSHGVNFDLEFSWGTAVRDGFVLLLEELRAKLDAEGLVNHEISVYCNPTLNTNQWDVAGMAPHLDYLIFSGYDFATGSTPNAVGDWALMADDNSLHAYLERGLPPEKLVLAFPMYGRTWDNTTAYGVSGGSTGYTGVGFTDGLYDTRLNPTNGGPHAHNYRTGDEAAWYTFNNGTARVVTWEGEEGVHFKMRQALSVEDSTTGVNYDGRRIRGIAMWSLRWLAETSSIDPRTNTTVTRTRTYPHVYQVLQEVLAQRGRDRFLIDGFEGYDFRWRDPYLALDTVGDTDRNSTWDNLARPGGTGAPSNSSLAAQITFDFEGAGPNTGVFAHEVLNSPIAPTVRDRFAVAALFDRTTLLRAPIHTATAYSGRTARLLIIDRDGEVEASPTVSLNATGWRELTFDLNAAATAFNTSEPHLVDGDGVIDTAGAGARDIAFYGLAVQGGGAGNVVVVLDEITYEHRNPGGLAYTINEIRYDGSANEFIEIHGPAGPLPSGLQLRRINGTTGAITSLPITGTISNDGAGFGLFVFGDTSTPNVDQSAGFGAATDDLPDGSPSGLQLYSTITGGVYDSVVYEAFGGLDNLVRMETLGVTDEGYPWLGRIATGTDGAGAAYTKGRFPDGADTGVNSNDFSVMVASPGLANGGRVGGLSATYSFETVPPSAFQTFQSFAVVNSAVGASPGGGRVHRCVDTSGGGAMSFIGDAALGAGRAGYRVSGQVYIPGPAEPVQAIGVGFCGRQGSHFFTAGQAAAGYESGYWIIYENATGAALNDGRPDHPGVFEFVHATNDNMDGAPVSLLGSASLATAGITSGRWTTFELIVDPEAVSAAQLIARIGGHTIYSGPLPADGPVSGAVQFGFRENHTGAPAATEGTWVDSVSILPLEINTGWQLSQR